MPIQQWLIGVPEYQRQAEQGILTKLTVSTTVTIGAATLAPTDFCQITAMGAAGAIKVLGGSDTGNGPCTPGDSMIIANHSGQNITIFPNNANGTVKNQSAGTGFLIATGLTAFLYYLGGDNWTLTAN